MTANIVKSFDCMNDWYRHTPAGIDGVIGMGAGVAVGAAVAARVGVGVGVLVAPVSCNPGEALGTGLA